MTGQKRNTEIQSAAVDNDMDGADNGVIEQAAEATTALNPVLGISTKDVIVALASTAYNAVRHPISVAKHSAIFGAKLVDIYEGNKDYQPGKKDRRFNDESWQEQSLYRFLMQSYFALGESLGEWSQDDAFEPLDKKRARFITSIIFDSLAPTNTLLGNPAAMKKAWESKGSSLLNGFNQFLSDLKENGGMPSQVDKSRFAVGKNLALSEGKVVFRNDFLELIQYSPQTDEVYNTPFLIIPPQINKYYIYDLAPQKSFIEYTVKQGIQTHVVSWRNPHKEHADWSLSDYIIALTEAIVAIKTITGSDKVNVMGACSGGITASVLTRYMDAIGDDSINSLSISVCSLSQREDDTDIALFMDDERIESARQRSSKDGILSGKELSRVFAWMRPNDLIWNYVVNNYLMGEKPPAFDVLYWNNDTTNLPAQLHGDYLDIIGKGMLENEGEITINGQPVALHKSTCDKFIIAGQTDHITPWEACYRSTHILGGNKQFILCNSGHVQTLLCPPGNPRSKYYVNNNIEATPQQWLDGAEPVQGSWWQHWIKWLQDRSEGVKPASIDYTNDDYPILADAPGSYVHEQA